MKEPKEISGPWISDGNQLTDNAGKRQDKNMGRMITCRPEEYCPQ